MMAMIQHLAAQPQPAQRWKVHRHPDGFAYRQNWSKEKHPAERDVVANANQRTLAAVELHRGVAPRASRPSPEGIGALGHRETLGLERCERVVQGSYCNVERELIHDKKAR